MTVVYKIDTGKYDPISHGSNYLYNQFDRIQSFLIKLNPSLYKNILAKPVLSNSQVLWYANYDQPFSRLSDQDEQTQISIKSKYWEVRQMLDHEIQQLALSKDTEKQNWADLLKNVFSEDDNVILTDGNNWCLLWGWKFRNKQENYLAPEFMPKLSVINSPIQTDAVSVKEKESGGPTTTFSGAIKTEPEKISVLHETPASLYRIRPSLWDRIKRFLRTTVYRLWGLMLLIMFILFLACLFKYCSNKRAQQNCREMDELNKKLIELDKKVQDRCEQPNR
jgi:hypothetical protein